MRFLSILLLIFLTGCISLGTKSDPVNIPAPPEREYAEKEGIQQNVDVITDIAHIAYTTGVNAQSYESEILLKSAKVLQTIAGLPTTPIDWMDRDEIEDLHEDLLKQEEQYRIEKAEWERLIKGLEKDNSHLLKQNSLLQSALDKFKFWFWLCAIILGVLCFFAPTIGIPFVRFLLGRAKKLGETAVVETAGAFKSQMSQVVNAIEDFKKEEPEKAKTLLDNLQRRTDSNTRSLIKELKD